MAGGLPPIWDNYKKMTSSEKDEVKLWVFVGSIVIMVIFTAILNL